MIDERDSLLAQQVTPLALAESLIDALDEDWGEPGINYHYQFALISTLHWLPYHEDAADPEDVALEVRNGLLAFYNSMPKTSPIGNNLDGTAVLYYAIAGALQSASLVAYPGGDTAVSNVRVEIASYHSGNHPVNNNSLLSMFLSIPADPAVWERYQAAIAEAYGADEHTPVTEAPPVFIPFYPGQYAACVDGCWDGCAYHDHWWEQLGCGLLCILQCVPDLVIPHS